MERLPLRPRTRSVRALPSSAGTGVTSNLTVTALYTPVPTYMLTYAAGGSNVKELPQGGTYAENETVTAGEAPTRTGYDFAGWESSEGNTVQAGDTFVMPAAEVTLTAQWERDPASSASDIPEQQEPMAGTLAEQLLIAAELAGIPIILGMALITPAGFSAWSLANILLVILSVIAALGLALIRLRQSRAESRGQKNERAQHSGSKESQGSSRSSLCLAGAIIAALVEVALFVLTQDVSLPVVWVDVWTIVNALLFAAILVLGSWSIRQRKSNKAEERDTAAVSLHG